MSLTKTQKQKIFFHCRLEDLLSILRVWTSL